MKDRFRGKLLPLFSTGCVRDAGRRKKGLEANYVLYVYLWHIFIFAFDFFISASGVCGHLSQELEENKRLPGIPLAAERTETHTHDASLSAAIQMSCVACAATSRRGRGYPPTPTPLHPACSPTPKTSSVAAWTDPRRPSSPASLLFPAPSGRPRPTPATITRQHSRLPLPVPGAGPACQPPGSTGRAQTWRQLTSRRTAAVPNSLPISLRC